MTRIATLCLLLLAGQAMADGRQLLEGRCMECHVMDGEGGGKEAAPPMYAVWHHYRQRYPQREDFIAAVSAWLLQPREEASVMKGAIAKFGMMKPIEISKEDALALAGDLFDSEFAIPNWYLVHYSKMHGNKGPHGDDAEGDVVHPREEE